MDDVSLGSTPRRAREALELREEFADTDEFDLEPLDRLDRGCDPGLACADLICGGVCESVLYWC